MIDISRSPTAPKSLAKNKGYDGFDVKEQLLADFLGKCYLTEVPLTLGSLTIDHRKPQKEFHELRYEWTNLFPCSYEANVRRPKWPDGGLIDPSNGECVEQRVQQWLDDDMKPMFMATDSNDRPAVNTAEELKHIHNDSGSLKAADLRDTIKQRLSQVLLKMHDYRDMKEQPQHDPTELRKLEYELRKMLSREAPFTMLIRSRVRNVHGFSELFD